MELKPCPFCGCKRILITREASGFKLSCSQCSVFMVRRAKPCRDDHREDSQRATKPDDPEPYYSPHDTQDEAYQNLLDRWNRRTPPAPSPTPDSSPPRPPAPTASVETA